MQLFRKSHRLLCPHIRIVPNDQCAVGENGKGILRLHLSHEGAFEGGKTFFSLLRNSVVDSINGSINVRLLEQRNSDEWDFCIYESCCVDLTLQKPSLADVSPITIR